MKRSEFVKSLGATLLVPVLGTPLAVSVFGKTNNSETETIKMLAKWIDLSGTKLEVKSPKSIRIYNINIKEDQLQQIRKTLVGLVRAEMCGWFSFNQTVFTITETLIVMKDEQALKVLLGKLLPYIKSSSKATYMKRYI